jgi:hypothetical protein
MSIMPTCRPIGPMVRCPTARALSAWQFYSPTPGASNSNSGPPPASFIAYNTDGSIYTQNFDSLPDPGATSVNTAIR